MTGIVILDYNNAHDTINCIESVRRYTPYGSYKLFIVENGSDERTVREISDYVVSEFADENAILHDGDSLPAYPYVTLLLSSINDGYACGNNKALRLLDADKEVDYVMVLNNDILFIQDIIGQLKEYSSKLECCGIVSPMLLKKDEKSIDMCCARRDFTRAEVIFDHLFSFVDVFGILSRLHEHRNMLERNPELAEKEYFEIEIPSGSCMFISKEKFRQLGHFDPNTFLYFEEDILYRKSQSNGFRSYLIPGLKCIHIGAATTTRHNGSYFLMNTQMRSHEYYLRNYCHAPFMAMFVRVMSHLTLFKILILSLFR